MGGNKRLIAKIMYGDTLVMTIDQNLISAEFGALDRGSLTSVAEWGIYVNRGSLSFVDNSGFFNNDTTNNAELFGYTIKFYLANRTSETLIATFKIESASFDDETRTVTAQCVSRLGELQRTKDLLGTGIYGGTDALTLLNVTLYRINDSMPVSIYPDQKGSSDLAKTSIHAPYLLGGESAWSHINNICQATMSRVFDDENGNGVIAGAFPNKTPIAVMPKNILDIPSNDFVIVRNCAIEEATIDKKDGQLTDSHTTFLVSRDQDTKDIISISNSDYTINKRAEHDVTASISATIDTPYILPTMTTPQDVGTPGSPPTSWFSILAEVRGDAYEGDKQYNFGRVNIGYGLSITQIVGSYAGLTYTVPVDSIFPNVISGNTAYLYATSIEVDLVGKHFINKGTERKQITKDNSAEFFEISSNDLIQKNSYVRNGDGSTTALADYILQEVSSRYGKGIECFEIECLFNDYYNENGVKVFDSGDISQHFKKYDVIIPYVQKNGRVMPLRTNENGEPKKFRIIGISYLYDGLLRQKLQVQEERYDYSFVPPPTPTKLARPSIYVID